VIFEEEEHDNDAAKNPSHKIGTNSDNREVDRENAKVGGGNEIKNGLQKFTDKRGRPFLPEQAGTTKLNSQKGGLSRREGGPERTYQNRWPDGNT